MQISGRVTSPFFCFLKRRFDTSRFHEFTQIEMSFIKDSGVWMPAHLVESFLKALSNEYGPYFKDQKLTTLVGHNALKLSAWGDLDQILKLSQPSDFYQKIENILQWFISPLLFRAFQSREEFVAFQCNFSSKDYPYITDYMRAVIEILPSFKSQKTAQVQWEEERVQIQLSSQMAFVMDEDDPHPSLVKKLKKSLFLLERDFLKQKKLLEEQDKQIKQFQSTFFKKEKIQSFCYQIEKILKQSNQLKENLKNELFQYINEIKKQIDE